jgi:hypothetical protein
MFQTHRLSRVALSLILKSRRDMEDRIDTGTFYIGVGDRFDDDRRIVRVDALSGGTPDYPKVQVLLSIGEGNANTCTISATRQCRQRDP